MNIVYCKLFSCRISKYHKKYHIIIFISNTHIVARKSPDYGCRALEPQDTVHGGFSQVRPAVPFLGSQSAQPKSKDTPGWSQSGEAAAGPGFWRRQTGTRQAFKRLWDLVLEHMDGTFGEESAVAEDKFGEVGTGGTKLGDKWLS